MWELKVTNLETGKSLVKIYKNAKIALAVAFGIQEKVNNLDRFKCTLKYKQEV